ncbi:MAG: hypothetical protein ACREIA_14405 [Opitutaceae bacterium]
MSSTESSHPVHPLAGASNVEGLTVREYLAAAALLGLLSSGKCLPELAGELAVRAADDALDALERSKPAKAKNSRGA